MFMLCTFIAPSKTLRKNLTDPFSGLLRIVLPQLMNKMLERLFRCVGKCEKIQIVSTDHIMLNHRLEVDNGLPILAAIED